MKTFGTESVEWRDADGVTHVIVAAKNSAWMFLCKTNPRDYVAWDNNATEPVEESTVEPLMWKHDRAKIGCADCLAMLDGAAITFVPVIL